MKAIKIKENIYWVGAIDWNLRNFHGYLTQKGSTYNAYLVIDDEITLIDGVKSHFHDEMINRISSVVDPKKITNIISNHVEMDHSGSFPQLLELLPNAKIYTTSKGANGLKKHFSKDWNFITTENRENLKTGKFTFEFIHTPMVHWPDNMMTYIKEEKILFSNDSFGQHLATSERFDNDYSHEVIKEEAKKYFANIVLPYTTMVQKELNEVKDLDIEIIAPSHGIIIQELTKELFKLYTAWSANTVKNKAVIIYDSMWGSTAKIASAIELGFLESGHRTVMFNLQYNHISDIMTEIIDANYICVGSPTLNNNMLPTVAGFLTYLKCLAPKGRIAMAFGSFGWGGQSIGQVHDQLESAKFQMLDPIKINYIPQNKDLNEITSNISNICKRM